MEGRGAVFLAVMRGRSSEGVRSPACTAKTLCGTGKCSEGLSVWQRLLHCAIDFTALLRASDSAGAERL